MNRTSVSFIVGLIGEKLKKHISIHREYQTINNLIDLDIQDDSELKSLGSQYTDILQRKPKIIEECNSSAHILEALIGFITFIYIDYHKLKGSNVQRNVPELKKLIKNDYDTEKILNFMIGGDSTSSLETS